MTQLFIEEVEQRYSLGMVAATLLLFAIPLLASMANAGRHGVLVKSAVVMEELGTTTRVAFDKTSTLIEGTPRRADIKVLPGTALSEKEILVLAAAAENPSEHPLPRAIVTAATDAASAIAQPGQRHGLNSPVMRPPCLQS